LILAQFPSTTCSYAGSEDVKHCPVPSMLFLGKLLFESVKSCSWLVLSMLIFHFVHFKLSAKFEVSTKSCYMYLWWTSCHNHCQCFCHGNLLNISINTLASGCFRGFSKKKRLNAHGFAREFLQSGMLYRPGKSLKRRDKSFSLHSKKFFLLGGFGFFCEWRHKWRTFRPPCPTLPGPGRQWLGGSISLKFLLETRLQSESFDTLDDLLGFQVQKLWCKLVKIFH